MWHIRYASRIDGTPGSLTGNPHGKLIKVYQANVLCIVSCRLHVIPADNSTRYRTDDSVTYDGAPAELLEGSVMISVCPLAITALRMKHFHMVSAHLFRDYQMLLHNSTLVDTGRVSGNLLNGFVYCYDSLSWAVIGVISITTCLLLWFTERSTSHGQRNCFRLMVVQLSATIWEMLSTLLQNGTVKAAMIRFTMFYVVLLKALQVSFCGLHQFTLQVK